MESIRLSDNHSRVANTGCKSTHWIPPLLGREAPRATAGIAPRRDVVKRDLATRVQERIHETHRRAAFRDQAVIEQRYDAREQRCARACARHIGDRTSDVHLVGDALRGHVRVPAPGLVEEPCVRGAEDGEVAPDRIRLVRGLREDI